MARFEAKDFYFSDIHGGERYENGDVVDANAINAPIEASAYAAMQADKALSYAIGNSTGTFPPLSAYPIGSVYISFSDISPASLFGGTWERVKDKFLLASGDTYTVGSTGGSATHTLTVEEMPSHYHDGIKNPDNYHLVGSAGSGVNGRTTSNLEFVENFGALHTNNAGGGQSHNNMPPYITVNIWKRIA